MKRPLIIVCALMLSACNQYTLVKPGLVEVQQIAVSPTKPWNSAPSVDGIGGYPTWTTDGVILNSVTFFPAIRNGNPLFKSSRDDPYPVFTTDLLPNEIVEIIESSVAKELGATISGRSGLKPLMIDGNPGFQSSFDFIAGDVPRRAFVAGAVKGESLYLMLYQATDLYYYDKYLGDVMSMAAGMRLN